MFQYKYMEDVDKLISNTLLRRYHNSTKQRFSNLTRAHLITKSIDCYEKRNPYYKYEVDSDFIERHKNMVNIIP